MQSDEAIEFWLSIGSTYTYLTVARIHQIAASTGVRFVWRPFNVRAIMREMDNIPFATKPIKMAYMWHDIERRAAKYGVPIKMPAPYPLQQFDLANRVAMLGTMEGWCQEYVCATYRRCLSRARRRGASQIFQVACGKSDRTRSGLSPCLSRSMSAKLMTLRRTRPDGRVFSERQRL